MGTTKILVVANSPLAVQRLEQTLSGLDVQVAIRLRDVAKAVQESEFALVAFCLGFDEQSSLDLLYSLRDAQGRPRVPVVAIVCDDTQPTSREMEARLREGGACDFFALRDYSYGVSGNAALRRRLLGAVRKRPGGRSELGLPPPASVTPMSRTLYRAALIAGSVALLARQLDVPEEALRRWIQGEEDPTPAAFLAALEFVLAELDRHNSPTN